jgi:hypothetical protein
MIAWMKRRKIKRIKKPGDLKDLTMMLVNTLVRTRWIMKRQKGLTENRKKSCLEDFGLEDGESDAEDKITKVITFSFL